MLKTNKKQVKTTTKQKILLIIFGIFLTLLTLEIGLRVGGFVVSSYQRSMNKEDFDADYRILCLGESTTADEINSSWPAQLEVILNNKSSEIKFKIFNEGVSGTTTAFIFARLKGNLDKYKPNMVITMMGVNDKKLSMKYEKTLKVKIVLLLEDLRVYKLSKLLLAAWNNKIQSTIEDVNTTEEAELIKEEGKNETEKYIELGRAYLEQGIFKEAEEMFKKAVDINPNDNDAYVGLGRVYWKEKEYKEAEEMLKKAVDINPNSYESYIGLGRVYQKQDMFEEAGEMFMRAIEINPNDDDAYIRIGKVYYEQGIPGKKIEEFYNKREFPFKLRDYIPIDDITRYHYQQLYKELNKREIKYIAMQYPTLDVNELKNMFEGDEDTTFVNNEENFKKALETGKYEEYFIDYMTDTFGHATPKGNRLIAENVANVILTDLGIKKGD